jgi:D-aminopeptidase
LSSRNSLSVSGLAASKGVILARARLRDLGIPIGKFPTGKYNAISDVPGVLVGHCTVIHDEPRIARTGVTMIVPRDGDIANNNAFAGWFSFNGCGEMTGVAWIEESGLLTTPIGITNTGAVGVVHSALAECDPHGETFALPVVTETYDGWLNDFHAFHVTKEHAVQALNNAKSGLIEEGNVGGGTGMICHDFKGGIGTSSRLVNCLGKDYTVGVLVQSNYGDRHLLRVDGVPVGKEIDERHTPMPWEVPAQAGSIIIIVATNAPLLPTQCNRLAKRATVGLARVGSVGHNGSGDLFLTFATGNELPVGHEILHQVEMLPHKQMNLIFEATAEATEEAILNSLTAAETMTGYQGHTAYALPLVELQRIMAKYRPTL